MFNLTDYAKQHRYRTNPRRAAQRLGSTRYIRYHKRVYSTRGQPAHCEHCGRCGGSRRNYEWANLTQRYDDPDDYIRLCISCHRRMDSTSNFYDMDRSGTKNGRARLTEADVQAIGHMIADGKSMTAVARRYGIGRTTVSHIWAGRTWVHVPRPTGTEPRKVRGSMTGTSKLTEGDIPVIRVRLRSGESCRAIARVFHVGRKAIAAIKHGRTWRSVDDPHAVVGTESGCHGDGQTEAA